MDDDRIQKQRLDALLNMMKELMESPTPDTAARVRARFVVAAMQHITHEDAIDALFDAMGAVQAMVAAVEIGRTDLLAKSIRALVRAMEGVFEPVNAIVDSTFGIKSDERK